MVVASNSSKWYVVHCHSGFEKKIADAIMDEASKDGIEDLIEEVSVLLDLNSISVPPLKSIP